MQWRNVLWGSAEWTHSAAHIGFAILRAFAGFALALQHGIHKVPPSERFVQIVGEMGFPVPGFFAWAAAFAESVCAMLMAVGLWTRPAALLVTINMAVAAFIRHAGDPFARRELALLYFCIAFAFMLAGGGRYSLDAWLRGRSERR